MVKYIVSWLPPRWLQTLDAFITRQRFMFPWFLLPLNTTPIMSSAALARQSLPLLSEVNNSLRIMGQTTRLVSAVHL